MTNDGFILTYYNKETDVKTEITIPHTADLYEMAYQFRMFLHASGFTYVTDVTIETKNNPAKRASDSDY